jgi:hypothetical protein
MQLVAGTIYTASLSGTSEVPPNASTATGFATLTLNGDSLKVDLTFTGLIGGPATAAHIHCCTTPGNNAAVALPFVGLPTATSGTYSQTYDLTLAATYTSAFITSSGGTATAAEAALIAGLNAGQAYVNIHDATFPGGEIEGFAASSVPEPGSALLLGLGLTAIATILNSRRA